MPTWDELANSERWRGLVSFIRNWIGPFDSSHGMSPAELERRLSEETPNLPTAVREWYLLAGHWNQGGLNVWIKPEELEIEDESDVIVFLTDDQGTNDWCIYASDVHHEDPPVILLDGSNYEIVCSHFSEFVAAMVINDYMYADEATGDPTELDSDSVRTTLTRLISSRFGDYFADAPLETASVVAFAYPNSTSDGKARTPEGRALLERLQA